MIAPVSVMNNRRLQQLIQQEARIVEGESGFWRIEYHGRTMLVITDESHNRMRIMTPVVDDGQLNADDYRRLLSANFDRALDARYALSKNVLWSLFLHPLSELTEHLFVDALEQVCRLAENFGGSYSSGDLYFGSEE